MRQQCKSRYLHLAVLKIVYAPCETLCGCASPASDMTYLCLTLRRHQSCCDMSGGPSLCIRRQHSRRLATSLSRGICVVRTTSCRHDRSASCCEGCDISRAMNNNAAIAIGSHCSWKWFPISILAIFCTCQLRDLRRRDGPATSPSRGRYAKRMTADMCMTRFACRAVALVYTSIRKDCPW